MGLRFPEQANESCFYVTTTFKDWEAFGEVDGLYERLIKSLNFCVEKYSARISGYVLMPTHIHLLLFINGDKLSGFIRDLKKYIAQKAARELGIIKSLFWMPRYDRVAIRSLAVFRTKLEYIHNNPVRAGLAEKAEDWYLSSATDYGSEGNRHLPVWKDWG